MEFANDPIPVDRMPRLRDDAFVAVDPRYLRGRLTAIGGAAIVAVVIGAVVIVATPIEPFVAIASVIAALVVLALSAGLAVVEVRRLAYQLRDHDVSLRSGVITHRTETVPFSRVQHVNLTRGPVERSLGLATLEVTSAGPNISIPGLAVIEAERVKQLVAERADIEADNEAKNEADNEVDSEADDRRAERVDTGDTRTVDLETGPAEPRRPSDPSAT